MRRWSSSFVSQFLVAGLVVGALPLAAAQTGGADEPPHITMLTTAPSSADLAAEHRYLELAEASTVEPGPTATVEESATALAASLAAIPVGDLEGAASCPTEKLTVSWDEPGPEYTHGAFVAPLGPAPGPATEEVNGVVLCEGYPYAFMGFEALRKGSSWEVVAVPFLGSDSEEHGHEPANDDADDHRHDHDREEAPVPAAPAPRIDVPVADLGPIEGYAAYEPQRICHPTAKPGTDALRRLLTGHYTSTRNLGIARGCSVGGRSEHKEGRAFDWGAYVHRDVERKSVEDLIGRLLATDEAGNRHALARRMGVMYIIWNERIWSAYRHEGGWRPYGGRSPHTDHVHISLSWDGAMGRTSFWTANGVEALFGTPAGTTVAAAKPVHAAPAPADGHAGHDDHDEDRREVTDEATERARSDRDEAREEYERRIREWREARERRQREREERRGAGLPIDEETEAEVAAREAEEAAEEAKEALEDAEDEAEKAERRAQREADRAARRAELQTEREQREQAREERRGERQAEREERQQERDQRRADERAVREQRQAQKEAERAERQAQKDAERAERQAQKDAERAERQAQKDAERAERQAQKDAERAERQAQKEREREERRAQKERERAERQAHKDAERAERQAQKEREREERRAQKEADRAERRGG